MNYKKQPFHSAHKLEIGSFLIAELD